MENNEIILEVNHLKKYFKAGKGKLKAVDDVSFFIRKGETLGVVGESGCGKTTCGRTCIGIYGRTDGEVLYKGKDVHKLKGKEKKDFTKEVQIIFQAPIPRWIPRRRSATSSPRASGLTKRVLLRKKSRRWFPSFWRSSV